MEILKAGEAHGRMKNMEQNRGESEGNVSASDPINWVCSANFCG